MQIYDLRINGINEPVGFLMDAVRVSWKVKQTTSTKAIVSSIVITDEDGTIIGEREGMLESLGEVFNLTLLPRKTYRVSVYVKGDKQDEDRACTSFTTGKQSEKWRAKWIGKRTEDDRNPVFFKNVFITSKVKKAFLHICGLGLFESFIDGEKIGDEYLTPYLSEYGTEQQIITFDVTKQLQKRESHILEVCLGEGWYMGRFGGPDGKNVFGTRMALIAELYIIYENGKEEVIITDESWSYKGSDIESANIYDGEVLNRLLWENTNNKVERAVLLNNATDKLIDRVSLPVKAMEILDVDEIITTPAGETVLDFGQNHAGMVFFNNTLPKGTKVVFDHGEVLQNGNFYNDNYRSAKAQFVYMSDGRSELVRSHFTFYGFRYVRVTGWPGEIKSGDIKSMVLYSDIEQTGTFTCGNDKINRLFLNSLWGLKSNFIDMPTDCPQRDERLGWTGDAQVFSATANLHCNAKVFYGKYLRDLRNYQVKEGGAVPSSIPMIGGMNLAAAVWGDAATIIPMNLYRTYRDKELLKKHFPMMVDWIEYIHAQDAKGRKPRYLYDFGFQWGDWLALDGATEQSTKGGTEDAYVASIYYYNSVKLTAEAAEILGEEAYAEKYRERADKIRKAILDEYFTPSGRLCIDTQTGYIIALYYGVYRKREVIVEHLKRRLSKDNHTIRCGFAGAPLMCQVLAENDMQDEAYTLLFNEDYPGWLYEINLDATTIWERWNSLLPDGKISGTDMNSLNHYSYGSIAEFLYENAAGIKCDADGYRSVIFEPAIDARFQYVSCSYESPCGCYSISWKITDEGFIHAEITVPFGCTAKVRLPRFERGEIAVTAGEYIYDYEPLTPFAGKTLDKMTIGELIAHRTVGDYIRENAYPLMALAESNGATTMMMPANLALETAVQMCGLSPSVAGEIERMFSEKSF